MRASKESFAERVARHRLQEGKLNKGKRKRDFPCFPQLGAGNVGMALKATGRGKKKVQVPKRVESREREVGVQTGNVCSSFRDMVDRDSDCGGVDRNGNPLVASGLEISHRKKQNQIIVLKESARQRERRLMRDRSGCKTPSNWQSSSRVERAKANE